MTKIEVRYNSNAEIFLIYSYPLKIGRKNVLFDVLLKNKCWDSGLIHFLVTNFLVIRNFFIYESINYIFYLY